MEWAEQLVGQTVNAKYRLTRLLGEGFTGAVFEATQLFLKKRVAVKVLRPEFTETPEAVRRFQQEAQAIARIEHDNIVGVSDFDRMRDGAPYFVMDLIEGSSLEAVLHSDGPLRIDRALHIATQIANALGRAHEAHIVHRDLKPANVMLVGDDVVKVVDFGIARILDAVGERLTRSGEVFGTPWYVAPEQAIADPALDHRADIYALGGVLYEMLTGTPPFDAPEYLTVVHMHISTPPQAPSSRGPALGIPAWLDEVVLHMLAKDPAARPQSMADVQKALAPPAAPPSA